MHGEKGRLAQEELTSWLSQWFSLPSLRAHDALKGSAADQCTARIAGRACAL